MSSTVVPFVRKLIPCLKVELTGEGADGHYVLTEPLTVIDQPDSRINLAVYALLVEGIGTVDIQLEVRHTKDGHSFRNIGWSPVVEVSFSTATRGLQGGKLAFALRQLPMMNPGVYEFRITSNGEDLPGERAEIRVIS